MESQNKSLFDSFRLYGGNLETKSGETNPYVEMIHQQLEAAMFVQPDGENPSVEPLPLPPCKSSFGARVFAASKKWKDPEYLLKIQQLHDDQTYVKGNQ